MKNKNIINAIKKFKIILFCFFVFQIIGFVFFVFLLSHNNEMFSDAGSDFFVIKFIFLLFYFVLCFIIDIFYFYRHILKRKSLITVEQRECIVEDFIITYYFNNSSDNIRYAIEPVVRDIKTNKLYFTYSDFNLSYYNSVTARNGKSIINKAIFRKDGTIVNVGDKAYFYIKKILDVDVNIINDRNFVILKCKNSKRKLRYNNINKNYSINNFNNFIFFEGCIEVEKINTK